MTLIITSKILQDLEVSPFQIYKFKSLYPQGLELTAQNLELADQQGLDICWFCAQGVRNTCDKALRAHFNACTNAGATYETYLVGIPPYEKERDDNYFRIQRMRAQKNWDELLKYALETMKSLSDK